MDTRPPVDITLAQSAEQLEASRTLFREYAAQLGVDLGFQGFEDELADDVRRLWGSLRHICMVRAEYTPRCRHCMDRVDLVDADRQPASPESFAYGLCRGCGETYPKGPALAALGTLQDFTLPELAERVNIRPKTLYDWARKEWITPSTPAAVKRDRLYSLDDVLRVRDRLRGSNDADAISA